jgi:hypothetical protein
MIFCSYQMEETTSTDQEGPDTMTTTINPQDAPVQERTKESLLPQIQKLIDLSATPGMNQAEAAAMAERAEMLMFRHNVTMAMLAAYNVNERDITARRVTIGKPYTKEKVTLLCTVAAHMNVATMNFLDARGWRYPVDVELMGFPGDLDQVEQLYTSLLVQANRDMLTAEPTDPREHLACRGSGSTRPPSPTPTTAAPQAAPRWSWPTAWPWSSGGPASATPTRRWPTSSRSTPAARASSWAASTARPWTSVDASADHLGGPGGGPG